MSPAELDELSAFAGTMADHARPVVLKYFRQPLTVDSKADSSPVTVADREAESVLRRMINRHYPGHGLFGEEHGSENLEREQVWVVDPIDGTRSYITGMPVFGTLIALLFRGRPVIGVVDMPALGERWVGVEGRATVWNGRECRVSGCADLSRASLLATSPDMFAGEDRRRFEAVSSAARLRRFGGDCYAYGLLAAGLVDVVVEADLQPYDYCALVPVVQGAGGVITDWNGRELGLDSDGRVVAAASASLHAATLAHLAAS